MHQRNTLHCNKTRSSDTKPTEDSLVKSTIALLKSIEQLHISEDVLKENEVYPKICITYYENVTPPDYDPPGFSSTDTTVKNLIDILNRMSNDYVILGWVKTGFHTMKYGCKFAQKLEDSSSSEITNLDENETVPLHLHATQKSELSTGLKKEDNLTVDCLCSINEKINGISLIKCTSCTLLLHAPCVGYIDASEIEEPYYCSRCNNIDLTSSTPTDLRRHQVSHIFRLSLIYILVNEIFPYEVLNNVKKIMGYYVVKKLSAANVIEETKNGLLLNKDCLNRTIEKFFENKTNGSNSKHIISEENQDAKSPAKKLKTA